MSTRPGPTRAGRSRCDGIPAQIKAAEDQLRIAEDGVQLEVRPFFAELRASARSPDAARVSADAAEEAYRAQYAALDAGGSTLDDRLFPDQRATEARLADPCAHLGACITRARLVRAMGDSTP